MKNSTTRKVTLNVEFSKFSNFTVFREFIAFILSTQSRVKNIKIAAL
jgi:hypothetical protein